MKTNRYSILFFILISSLWSSSINAQNHYDHWAFGTSVLMDFSSGTPVQTCNASINSSEAAAVWSNPGTGDFIAYTSGSIVYNGQNHNVLANGTGLTANASSIESALILPMPGESLDKFYIFHNNITNTYYSIADMSIGANGTVTSKNNFLQATGSERCGTVPHGNICPAYWLVISKSGNDSVAAYLVDTNGISTTPVVTATGITGGNARGNIVFSEDFTKMGMSVENVGMFVCDFDNTTGQTSSWNQIGTVTNGFGSAFSPDGTKIYYTSGYGQNLYQYNFTNSTQTFLGGTGLSYLALAPDGKIYVSKYGQQSLGVVTNPNGAGTASGFQISGFTISGPSTCVCRWGLPNPFHVDIGYHPSQADTISLCPGEDTLYTTPVSGDSIVWNTGDTGASILLETAGLYYATIGFGDCSSSDSVYLQFVDEATISATTECLGDSTVFSYQSAMPASSIVAYDWDFGDGNSSSDANPSHAYAYGDTFSVSFELETSTGCVIDTFAEVVVHPNPTVEFSFDNVCDGEEIDFIDSSFPGNAPITSKLWDVNDDGSVDYTISNPSHLYSGFGNYTAKFTVIDAFGCDDSLSKSVSIHPLPNADFSAPFVCFQDDHQFTDLSSVATGSVTAWLWDFGDGDSSTLNNPTHEFPTPGQQNVTLMVTTDSGCTDVLTKNTTAYFLPVADFTASSVCEDETAVFNQNSISQSGNISSYQWSFGDGSVSSVVSPTHDYNGPGLYQVTLGVITNFGCEDTVQKNVRIFPTPSTAFGWDNNVCVGEDLPFYNQSSIAQVTPGGDSIISYEWLLNDEFFSDQQNPIYYSDSFGSVLLRLTTVSNYGCSTFSENTASIFPLPIAKFASISACQYDTSRFVNQSRIPYGLVSDYHWSFGDDSTSTQEHPGHVYAEPGTYNIQFAVASNKGCVDTTKGKITVYETPKLDYEISPLSGCADLEVLVQNKSQLTQGSIESTWWVGENELANENEAYIILTNDTIVPVQYRIRLITESNRGCVTNVLLPDTITVFPKPKADFNVSGSGIGMFDPLVEFDNNSIRGISYVWRFGDGTQSTLFEPTHEYAASGQYETVLEVKNEFGCIDTALRIVDLEPITTLYIPTAFTPNGDGLNEVWGVKGFNEGNDFNIKIFDRWGLLLIESNEMSFTWDGTFDGTREAPVGTYTYLIEYRTSTRKREELRGTFNLIR